MTWMEWAANANATEMVCDELGSNIRIHKGLAAIARNTQQRLSTELDSAIDDIHGPFHILLTGHSGGGAIAQLLFGFMHSGTSSLSRFKTSITPLSKICRSLGLLFRTDQRVTSISCVTFGGPPISNPQIPHPPDSMFLSFFNEGDPCALAEPNYLKYLFQAWVQDLPPDNDGYTWYNESPIYLPSGTQVGLQSKSNDLGSSTIKTSAFCVDAETRASLLFGNPFTHSMTKGYLPRIQYLYRQALALGDQDPFRDPEPGSDTLH
jgi:hypothetical protein